MEPINQPSSLITIEATGVRFTGHEAFITLIFDRDRIFEGGFFRVMIDFQREGEEDQTITLAQHLDNKNLPASIFPGQAISVAYALELALHVLTAEPLERLLETLISRHGRLQVMTKRERNEHHLEFRLAIEGTKNLPTYECPLDELPRFFSLIAAKAE